MTGGEPDRFDEQLSDSALDDLFHKSLEPGGDSVQKLLLDFMQDEWRELAERSRVRHQRPMPNQEDAFNAFSAIRISLKINRNTMKIAVSARRFSDAYGMGLIYGMESPFTVFSLDCICITQYKFDSISDFRT